MSKKKKMLFLCTGNSCRSQMAEGLTRMFKGDIYDVYSAGIETHGLNPHAVAVMDEIGIDITSQKSENIADFKDIDIDYVLTVCNHAAETCPIFPGTAAIKHFEFSDPPKMAKELATNGASDEEQLNCYRVVRDQIKEFVNTLPGFFE